MAIQYAEANIGYIYSPLELDPRIDVLGNVTPTQVYDAATGIYEPDYSTAFLKLRAAIDVEDPDGILTAADKVLANIRWYITVNGTEKRITGSTEYVIDGDTLTVKRNFPAESGGSIRLEADFLDPRTGEVWQINKSIPIICEGVSTPPQLTLDCGGVILYDPVRDAYPKKKIKASLKIGDTDVAAANRVFVWQKKDCDMDNAWGDIDGTDILDYDVEVSADGTELTVDASLIGNRIDVRCYAKYNPYGSAASVAIDAKTPMREFSVKRVKKKLRGVILRVPKKVRKSQKYVYPEVRVYDGRYEIPNPDSVLDIQWRKAICNKNGTVVKGAVIATGQKPTISITDIDVKLGAKIIAEFDVKPPLKALVSDGYVIVSDGKILLAR